MPNSIPLKSIYAKGAAGILLGSQHISSNAQGSAVYTTRRDQGGTLLVPELECKLGITGDLYTSRYESKISYDISYDWYEYFNGAEGPANAALQTTATSSFNRYFSTDGGSVGFQGVQFGLRYVANV